jgi:hypothetical protein
VPREVYNAIISGHQVVKKWIDSRKGRPLKHTDKEYLEKMFNAIAFSFDVQKEIDKVIIGFPLEVFDKPMIQNEVNLMKNGIQQRHNHF